MKLYGQSKDEISAKIF